MGPNMPSAGFRLLSRQLRTQRGSFRNYSRASYPSQQQSSQPTSKDDAGPTTDFGFERVAESLKASKVGAVFSSVASSYDTMNDLMSLGVHRLWKDHFVRDLNPGTSESQGWRILDVAGGTGDVAFRMLDHASNINKDNNTHVTVADINTEMLAEGKKRSVTTDYINSDRLEFVEANAEDLHMVQINTLDLYTVAFGIRNFTNKQAALNEAFRVLKPGGVFACLEFSKVDNALFNAMYKRWSFSAIPLIGQLVAGDRDSYQYLVESIEKFPSQEEFKGMIETAGFVSPTPAYENLSNGIAAIHKGIKPL